MFKTYILIIFLLLLFLPKNIYAASCWEIEDCPTIACPKDCPKQAYLPAPAPGGIEKCICARMSAINLGGYKLFSPIIFTDFGSIIYSLLPYIFIISGLILFFTLVSKGLELLTSGGDPKKIEGAKQGITSALIGFIIIFISFWIAKLLEIVFNIDILK